MIKHLEEFQKQFIDKVINRQLTDETEETEYYDEILLPEGKKDIEEFRSYIRENLTAEDNADQTHWDEILELIEEGEDIETYLDTTLDNEIALEFQYLKEQENETMPLDMIQQTSMENGTTIYYSIKDDFLISVEELDRLIKSLKTSLAIKHTRG